MSIFEVRGGSLYRKDAATAAQISFDNSGTDLISTNTQDVILELNSDLADKENKPTELTATLSAGATSVSFTNAAITSTAKIDVYTDTFGVNPTNQSVSGTTLTLTFKAQTAAVSVKVLVRG